MSEKNKLSMEIFLIASYCGLMKSKYILLVVFVIISFFNMYLGYTPTSIYILMVLVFLPYIITQVLQNRRVEEGTLTLSSYAKKYHYSKIVSIANNLTYTLVILLILLWILNFKTYPHKHLWFSKVPSAMMIIGISSRILITIYYTLKIKKSLSS